MAVDFLILLQDRGNQRRGDIIEVRGPENEHPEIQTPLFGVVRVGNGKMAEFEHANKPWQREIDYGVIGHNAAQDIYRLRMFSKFARGVKGAITRQQVEAFLTRWNASIVNSASNSVTFDAAIYQLAVSEAYHDRNVSTIAFTSLNYDQGTGIHSIRADYSAVNISATAVERHIISKGGTITDHQPGIIEYDIDRMTVINDFRQEIAQKADETIERRRYYLTEADLQQLEAAGRFVTIPKAMFLSKVKDKVTD